MIFTERIPVRLRFALLMASFAAIVPCSGFGQTQPAAPVAPSPAGPAVPLSPEARAILTMLHDRKDTLKDFVAKIDYSTVNKVGDVAGKRGAADFIMDPTRGPIFSADFTMNTENGKPKLAYHIQFIFDGRDFTIKDYGRNNDVKQFVRNPILPPGAKPGDAVTLNGEMTLPIGLDVQDVANNFTVTLEKSTDPNLAVLKLVPINRAKFPKYSQLVITVDKTLQLPVKLVQVAESVDTTISLSEIKINPGTAKMADSSTPPSEGWVERKG
jgi:hypothetical protein